MTLNHDDREDLAQVARIKAWQQPDSSSVALRNAMTDEIRRESRHTSRRATLDAVPVVEFDPIDMQPNDEEIEAAIVKAKRLIYFHGTAREALHRAVRFNRSAIASDGMKPTEKRHRGLVELVLRTIVRERPAFLATARRSAA